MLLAGVLFTRTTSSALRRRPNAIAQAAPTAPAPTIPTFRMLCCSCAGVEPPPECSGELLRDKASAPALRRKCRAYSKALTHETGDCASRVWIHQLRHLRADTLELPLLASGGEQGSQRGALGADIRDCNDLPESGASERTHGE